MDDYESFRGVRRNLIKWAIWIVFACFAVGALASVLSLGMKVISTPGRVLSKTLDTDNVITNYEWFKQQFQDVQAQDAKIAAAKSALDQFRDAAGPRSGWQFDDRQEFSRLSSVVLGLTSQRASMVAQYNARTKMLNRDVFRTSDLPAEIQ